MRRPAFRARSVFLRESSRAHHERSALAVAAALALGLVCADRAAADVTRSGDVSPSFTPGPVVDLTGQTLAIGNTPGGIGTTGTVNVTGGGILTVGQINNELLLVRRVALEGHRARSLRGKGVVDGGHVAAPEESEARRRRRDLKERRNSATRCRPGMGPRRGSEGEAPATCRTSPYVIISDVPKPTPGCWDVGARPAGFTRTGPARTAPWPARSSAGAAARPCPSARRRSPGREGRSSAAGAPVRPRWSACRTRPAPR